MRLGWQEIRRRAKDFSMRWKDAHYEKGETQTFYNEFFRIFGIDRKRVAIFERKIDLIAANRRGVLTSSMHMAWLRYVGGRMKSDYSYSSGLVYNTFPWPEASDKQKSEIETFAQAVLDAREAWPTSSLADLYDPDTMPANLRKAHAALDTAVDRLYRKKPFDSDRDRVEHLFGLYEKLVNPLEADGEKQNKRVNRKVARTKDKK